MEIGLIEAGDDLFDEVLGGAEAAALPEQERRFLIVDPGVHVEDRLQIAVYPVVSSHFSARRRKLVCVCVEMALRLDRIERDTVICCCM